nr:hypothetical protein [Chenggangzhangella methanolivorans]
MSGSIPARSKLKKRPVRPQPACTSSTISSAPSRFATSARARSQRVEATLSPPSP